MPFVQRVIQPVNLAQVNASGANAASGKFKFRCVPGKCRNNNCINRERNSVLEHNGSDENNSANIKDTTVKQQQQQQHSSSAITLATPTTTVIKAIVHTTSTTTTTTPIAAGVGTPSSEHEQHLQLNGDNIATSPPPTRTHNLTNGFAASFTYATDTEEDVVLALAMAPTPLSPSALRSPTTGVLPNMKKLKQHVEFLDAGGSTPTSPTRSLSRSSAPGGISGGGGAGGNGASGSASASSSRATSRERRRIPASGSVGSSPTAAKIVSGFEFDSISNITLSNALRQLASLVLIASDIFDDLQTELQQVGERARVVQRKITAVERRVYAYDPKKVTVPESDLFTFAQRKTHFDSAKLHQNELFTAETRPQSVRVLYEDAGKKTPPPTSSISPRSTSFTSADGLLVNGDGSEADAMLDIMDGGAGAVGILDDELVCTPVFGKTTRKMRTRIDAEIEIRLPAGIEDLRKWTSSEALGDVTVTPDCMHHVDTSISTSMVIGDNGVLTPALSPSVLSADAIDALYSINVSNVVDSTFIPNDLNKDVPLNHRLPSPEEQCKIIALRYPAEVISVDTSGKRFERMCMARKSTTGCYNHTPSMGQSSAGSSGVDGSTTTNNLNDDIQTVSRRSRSRKVRGKRRNTIAGIDQKEIQDAANGDSTVTSGEIKHTLNATTSEDAKRSHRQQQQQHDKSKKFGRSKSSDILKKESVALPYDKGKGTLTRLNSLKQWGRNRFKFMQRNDANSIWVSAASASVSAASNGASTTFATGSHDTTISSASHSANTSIEKAESTTTNSTAPSCSTKSASSGRGTGTGTGADIDDECVVHELISQKNEARFSHERKPSYSSSEKSMSVSSSGHLRGKLHLASCGNAVKLRDTSSLNRQRRNGISATGFGGKDEQPHSSSGNWSASSESGRASIGSEITMQPKSSASNTSLNVSSFHPSSGPPSSMLSRRRFLNTSASSSVTSEGTATPELHDGAYPNHLDDETSSAYSCDTEGYYTSFHMDSGLRTLKEEEPTLTPLQQAQHSITGNYSFGSQSNQTVLSAENEYELFGKGSTSTTTSSAGTVCTTLMLNGSGGDRNSLNNLGPDVPERISSLGKLNKTGSGQSNSASTSTLERSYSSSTIGSTLERTGTIKRNVNASLKLLTSEETHLDAAQAVSKIVETPESQEEEFNFEHQRIRKRAAQPLPEIECSESSDLEGVERIERIKQKTAINARRIPSMCIITPTTSDDENQSKEADEDNEDEDEEEEEDTCDPNKTLTNDGDEAEYDVERETTKNETVKFKVNEATGYCTLDIIDQNRDQNLDVEVEKHASTMKDHNLNNLKVQSSPNNSFNNMFGKLKVVLPSIKLSMPGKSSPKQRQPANLMEVLNDDELYDTAGEYVTIADISNNNRHNQLAATPKPVGASSLGIYYSNDIVRRRQQQQQGNEPKTQSVRETEYISLNELPYHLRKREAGALSRPSATHSEPPTQNDEDEKQKRTHCADAQSEMVSMYAEINELCEQSRNRSVTTTTAIPIPTATATSTASSQLKTVSQIQFQSQHKGPRVRVNAQGKFIYDSDSLKRRKGAHTTFAPGPYVKETESALPEISYSESEKGKVESDENSDNGNNSASNLYSKNFGKVAKTNAAAKLLFLNGGPAATRKIANVRPIVSTTPTRIAQPISNNMPITTANTTTATIATIGPYHEQQQPPNAAYNNFIQQQHAMEQKNLLANNTNPFFQATATLGTTMMPSPSAKSTSSTGSTISSSASTHTSGSATSSSTEEGYQRFYKSNDKPAAQALHYQQHIKNGSPSNGSYRAPIMTSSSVEIEKAATAASPSPFQRNTPVYWTLQNRRQPKLQPSSVTCRDDLYATPIRRSERMARAAAAAVSTSNGSNHSNISPIVPRGDGFSTSTPTKLDEDVPERITTCADRIGQSKTTLLDFKKLLLAKSAKTSPIQKKLSAVEILKKTSPAGKGVAKGTIAENNNTPTQIPSLNSSMKLLDLSGSPKTFANRRMLRQGQFGSPSKSFVPKMKPNSSAVWRNTNTVQRTDVMSTTIPEANSEEDHSTSGGSNSSRASSVVGDERLVINEQDDLSPSSMGYDMKRNIFLQAEANNFMRGELRQHQSFGRLDNAASNKHDHISTDSTPTATQSTMPALETAL